MISLIIKTIHKSIGEWPGNIALAGSLSLLVPGFGVAEGQDGFSVTQVQTELQDKVYHLSARMDYEFSQDVLDAIQSGVPMIVVMDIQLIRPRSYWWDKEIATLKQRFQLHYHALAEQYIVKNLNSGAQFTAPTLNTALFYLKDIKNLPLIDMQLLEESKKYLIRFKVSLEFDSLPAPLKFSAYTSRSWWLGSEWYEQDL